MVLPIPLAIKSPLGIGCGQSIAMTTPTRKRPHLLFVVPWFLYPRMSGGRIRTTDVLCGMKGGAFEVTLFSPAPTGEKKFVAETEQLCDRFVPWRDERKRTTLYRYANLLSRLPVSVALDRSTTARTLLASQLARKPDIVVFDFLHTAALAPEVAAETRKVLFMHNVESDLYERQADASPSLLARLVWRNQRAKMARLERQILPTVDAVVAVSERDRDLLQRNLGLEHVRTIPTSVDTESYGFTPKEGLGDLRSGGGKVVFVGSMDWGPNVDGLRWLMDNVWSRIRRDEPVDSVGRRRPRSSSGTGGRGAPSKSSLGICGLRR